MDEVLKKKFPKRLAPGPDYEGPKKAHKPGKEELETQPKKGGGTQKHPAKKAQPLSMKFLE